MLPLCCAIPMASAMGWGGVTSLSPPPSPFLGGNRHDIWGEGGGTHAPPVAHCSEPTPCTSLSAAVFPCPTFSLWIFLGAIFVQVCLDWSMGARWQAWQCPCRAQPSNGARSQTVWQMAPPPSIPLAAPRNLSRLLPWGLHVFRTTDLNFGGLNIEASRKRFNLSFCTRFSLIRIAVCAPPSMGWGLAYIAVVERGAGGERERERESHKLG